MNKRFDSSFPEKSAHLVAQAGTDDVLAEDVFAPSDWGQPQPGGSESLIVSAGQLDTHHIILIKIAQLDAQHGGLELIKNGSSSPRSAK